jgi:hypothetical protein
MRSWLPALINCCSSTNLKSIAAKGRSVQLRRPVAQRSQPEKTVADCLATPTAANSRTEYAMAMGRWHNRQRPHRASQLRMGRRSKTPRHTPQAAQHERPNTLERGDSARVTTTPRKLLMTGARATGQIHELNVVKRSPGSIGTSHTCDRNGRSSSHVCLRPSQSGTTRQREITRVASGVAQSRLMALAEEL